MATASKDNNIEKNKERMQSVEKGKVSKEE